MEEITALAKDTMNIGNGINIEKSEKTLSIIDLISSGGLGGNLVMGTLGILSIIAVYIS